MIRTGTIRDLARGAYGARSPNAVGRSPRQVVGSNPHLGGRKEVTPAAHRPDLPDRACDGTTPASRPPGRIDAQRPGNAPGRCRAFYPSDCADRASVVEVT